MEHMKHENKAKEPEVTGVEDDEDVMLPGFRFHPTDEELVGFYLPRKIKKKALRIDIIKEIDIYKYDPWDLPDSNTLGEKEWYFFCLRGRKYRNSIRPNRVTNSGFWKATGIDRPIYSTSDTGTGTESIGLKKSLVYYRGSAGKGTKTDWMMHEFRLPPNSKDTGISPSMQEAEVWTICKIFKRNSANKKYHQQDLKPVNKQQAADSSSKSSSLCSEVVNDHDQYKSIVFSDHCLGEMEFTGCNGSSQTYACQSSNSIAQTPLTTVTTSSFATGHAVMNGFYKDGTNWDELGRIMEFMMTDQPATHDCKYF